MTAETTSQLSVREVLEAAKRFFTGPQAVHPAWIETETPTHVSFSTFRSNVVVAAAPHPESTATIVRASSLRDEAAVGKFITFLNTESRPEPNCDAAAS